MSEPIVKNAADEKQVKEANRKILSARRSELNEVRALLATAEGRKFLWRLLERCGVYKSSYDQSGSRVYFNEGRREVGLWVLAEIIEAEPEAYVSLMKEAKGREANGG